MGVSELVALIVGCQPIDGVTFTGGEPFAQAGSLALLAEQLLRQNLSLMAFTGYEIEELTSAEQVRLLACLDVLVTGRFVKELKTDGLLWRGSSNQRVHLLSDRHAGLELSGDVYPSSEVIITDNGTQIVSGFPELGLLQRLDPMAAKRSCDKPSL